MKGHVPDAFLEKQVVDYLKRKAESDKLIQEDFSFKKILEEVTKEKNNVDEKRLEKMISKLISDGEITKKSKEINVYIPAGYENKFKEFKNKVDDSVYIFLGLMIGYLILKIFYTSFPSYSLKFNFDYTNPESFILILIYAFMAPMLIGMIALVFLKTVFNKIYKNIKFFREMIDFFGGVRVWIYALVISISLVLSYIILSYFMSYELNPYWIIGLFGGSFIPILTFVGGRKNLISNK